MVPPLVTLRTRLPPNSAMYRLPAASTATPNGVLSCAPPAALPSPPKPAVPLPAAVLMVPFVATLRTL